MAEGVCRLCDKTIGYGVRFYLDPENKARNVHARCFEEQSEKKIAARYES